MEHSRWHTSVTVLLAIIVLFFVYILWHTPRIDVEIGGQTFVMEVASTNAARIRGLSGHAPLGPLEGMVFLFDTPSQYAFWMKDMTFPLDIIWLDTENRIVDYALHLSPETYPKNFIPISPAVRVVEVASGTVDRLNVKIGDQLTFSK